METVEGTLQDHNSSHLRQCFYGIVPYGTVPKWVRLGLALTGLAGTDPNGTASRAQMDPLTKSIPFGTVPRKVSCKRAERFQMGTARNFFLFYPYKKLQHMLHTARKWCWYWLFKHLKNKTRLKGWNLKNFHPSILFLKGKRDADVFVLKKYLWFNKAFGTLWNRSRVNVDLLQVFLYSQHIL